MRTTLTVTGMTCGHCKGSVEEALKQVAGVRSARVDLEKGRAIVDYDEAKTSPRELTNAVADAGYSAEEAA
ncbi:MAG TPA: cation transporter [Longimicrobiales bacterium]|nr:cation transporter [Longimicrobiales bacterium]